MFSVREQQIIKVIPNSRIWNGVAVLKVNPTYFLGSIILQA